MKYGFGADLGGTTCKLGLFTTEGELIDKWEIPTDTSNNGENILKDISDSIHGKMVEKDLTRDMITGIGIGVPGAVTPDGVVNRCVNLGWGVLPIEKELAELSGLNVKAANDANIAALGESWVGSGRGSDSLMMVTLGTGIGGGVVINGKILVGHNGAAGEIGHINVNEDELEECGCGNHGCVEQYASATGIVRVANRRLAQTQRDSKLREIEGFSAKDVFDLAKDGDELALEIVRDICSILGKMIAKVCNVLNPEVVLIGGGVSKAGQIIIDELQDGFYSQVFHASRGTEIKLASLGNDAGIYGGMRLVMEE